MWQRHTLLSVLLLALLAAAVPCVAAELDPQPGFEEFHPDAAVRPDGEALLTWTRQQELLVSPFRAMAATLDPGTGQLGEIHEWGGGAAEQAVALASGYLAIRMHVNPNSEWFIQHLDASGRPVGAAVPLGFILTASVHPTPDGGAIVVAGGVRGTGGTTEAWRFGPNGNLLSGPTVLVERSSEAAVGVDAAGNIILVWSAPKSPLVARRFSPDLQPVGPVINVSRSGGGSPGIAVAPDGRFVVVFNLSYRLHFRAYRADGSSVGNRLPFSTPAEYVMSGDFELAAGKDGRILVAWRAYDTAGGYVIRSRSLSFAGRPLTRIFRLAQIAGGQSTLLGPSVEALPSGGFLVLWSRVEADGKTATLQSRLVSGR
jgi:hypothetical protein